MNYDNAMIVEIFGKFVQDSLYFELELLKRFVSGTSHGSMHSVVKQPSASVLKPKAQ